MNIVTPAGSPGGEKGKIGVGKWPRRSFVVGGSRSAAAHLGATNGTARSIDNSGDFFDSGDNTDWDF